MELHFLDFDCSDDEEGTMTWDAAARVPADRLPELLREITTVLAWAHAEFGPLRGPVESGGLWDYDLQYERDGQPLHALHYDPDAGQLPPLPKLLSGEQVSLTLSMSGSPVFAEAFTEHFGP